MAKHVTRRSYKKRASKKRRTIRKLKRTMRRKMQKGGNGSLGLVAPVFLLFAALFANNPTVTRALSIAQAVIGGGGDQQTGDNKRLNQMGGGEQFNRALDGLRDTITQDNISKLSDEERTKLINCIDTLQGNGGISDADIQQMGDNPQKGGVRWGLPSGLTDTFNSLKDGAAAAAASGLNAIKDAATKTFMEDIGTQIDKVKDVIIAKVSNMKDNEKQDCMKLILSYGIRLIKAKLSVVSVENIKNAMADKAANAKEKGYALLSQGSKLFSQGFGSGKSSSTLPTGNGGGEVIPAPIQPPDEEKKTALIAANIETVKNYDAAVTVSNAAKLKVISNQKNGIKNQAAEGELKQVQSATSTAYQVAFDAAKAAIAGGVPESEVVFPQVSP